MFELLAYFFFLNNVSVHSKILPMMSYDIGANSNNIALRSCQLFSPGFFFNQVTLGYCPDPGTPANGGRLSKGIDVFKYASNVTFYCDDGFVLVGTKTLTCVLGNSPQEVRWSAPLPQCAGRTNNEHRLLDTDLLKWYFLYYVPLVSERRDFIPFVRAAWRNG